MICAFKFLVPSEAVRKCEDRADAELKTSSSKKIAFIIIYDRWELFVGQGFTTVLDFRNKYIKSITFLNMIFYLCSSKCSVFILFVCLFNDNFFVNVHLPRLSCITIS